MVTTAEGFPHLLFLLEFLMTYFPGLPLSCRDSWTHPAEAGQKAQSQSQSNGLQEEAVLVHRAAAGGVGVSGTHCWKGCTGIIGTAVKCFVSARARCPCSAAAEPA